MMVRLNKFLANQGQCSRREADEWIGQGRVVVDGVVAVLGQQIDPETQIVTIAEALGEPAKRYYILNKPIGYLSSVSENEGPSLLRLIPNAQGLFPIGRLDKDSEGLILVTNDRTLTKRIIGQDSCVEKEYDVMLDRPLNEDDRHRLENGMMLLGERLRPCKIEGVSPKHCRVILTEGKNRQIRRMFFKIHNPVMELRRIRIGGLELGDLSVGKYRELTKGEVEGI